MTRLQQARRAISEARRARLSASEPRFRDPNRTPHPRRDYWRERARKRRQKAAA